MRQVRWLYFILLISRLAGQAELENPIPPRPGNHILDEARIFSREPEWLAALSMRLREFHQRTGFRVEVALHGSLIGSTVEEETYRLRERWLGADSGLVLAMETDSGNWQIGWQEPPVLTTANGQQVPVIGAGEVGPQDQIAIRNRLAELPAVRPGSVEDVEAFVERLLDGLDAALRVEPVERMPKGRFLMLGLGLLAGMLLFGMLGYAMVRQADKRANDRLYFPAVGVSRRLGAPLGGGRVSSRTFADDASA